MGVGKRFGKEEFYLNLIFNSRVCQQSRQFRASEHNDHFTHLIEIGNSCQIFGHHINIVFQRLIPLYII